MKITDLLVDMLVELGSKTYSKHVVFEKAKKAIYVVVLREIYGILVASLLFYKKFCGGSENIRSEFNPYNRCVASRIKVGKKHTGIFHVEDVMSSHVNNKNIDKLK